TRRQSRSTAGWVSMRSGSARTTTARPAVAPPGRLSCAAISASGRSGPAAPQDSTDPMGRRIRTVPALAFVAASTTILAAAQVVVLKTGFGNAAVAPRLWHKSILKALGFRVQVIGEPAPQRPLLIAANHVSWTDIAVLGSVVDVSFIAKSQMEGWPLLGWLSKLQRTVFVERERRHRAGDQANEIARRLSNG